MLDTRGLPGAERVLQGLRELSEGSASPQALLVCVAAGRLRRVGLPVPELEPGSEPQLRLYEELRRSAAPGEDPYHRYNAWLRELSSFLEAAEQRARSAR